MNCDILPWLCSSNATPPIPTVQLDKRYRTGTEPRHIPYPAGYWGGLATSGEKAYEPYFSSLKEARPTGLEPATSGSTVQCSNQLSYGPSERRLSSPVHGIIRVAFSAARPLRKRNASFLVVSHPRGILTVTTCIIRKDLLGNSFGNPESSPTKPGKS